MDVRRLLRVLLGGVILGLFIGSGWGQDGAGEWSRNQTGATVPRWMSPAGWTEQGGMEIWRTEIRPTGMGQGMLLSVVFHAQPGGFVRVIWKSASEAVTLSADLTEGNLHRHQRTLFLDASRMAEAGQIWIEAKGAALEKVRLEWVAGAGWGPIARGDFVQTGSGRLLRAAQLYGDSFRPEAAENGWGVVETLLHPGPIAIHKRSLRLQVPLAEAVDYARLEFWVAGLAADEAVLFSLNDGIFEDLRPEVPRLDDPGYRQDRDQARTDFAGWRQVVRFLPGHLLQRGANTFWFGPGGIPETGEVAIRDLRLQVVFAPKAAPRGLPAPGASFLPREPRYLPPGASRGLSFRSEGVELRP